MNARRALKYRGEQERRRFFVGVAVDASCSTATATIVAATGRGLDARFEVASHAVEEVPPSATDIYCRLARGECRRPTEIAVLAAQLAEVQAVAINRLSALEVDVWPRVLLVGIADPGLWSFESPSSRSDMPELPDYVCLSDAARLAELVALNIVDAFPARDVAHGGQGRPLDAIPLWLLAHHPQANRLLCQLEPTPRAIFLPASRDESGAARIELLQWESEADLRGWLGDCLGSTAPVDTLRMSSARGGKAALAMDELVLLGPGFGWIDQVNLRPVQVIDDVQLGVPVALLPAATAALLAMLHIDQVPGNLPMFTGAAAPRVLGRLTPGGAQSWNRLLRDLAFVRPLVTPLRAVI